LVNFDDNLVVLLMANSQWRRHLLIQPMLLGSCPRAR
jgi:hypothetical protein